MAKLRYTAQQVAAALTETQGKLTYAAKRLGCTYDTVQNYIDRYEECQKAQRDAFEAMGDSAEMKLYAKAMGTRLNPDGDTTALIFLLKTQFKKRGYVEKLEIDLNLISTIQKIEAEAAQQGLKASDLFNDLLAALDARHSIESQTE